MLTQGLLTSVTGQCTLKSRTKIRIEFLIQNILEQFSSQKLELKFSLPL